MGKMLRVAGTVLGAIAVTLVVVAALVYFLVLQYPELGDDPETGRWYRVSDPEMVCSDGSPYRALFKKGSGEGVLVYFAGGGVSINEETAAGDFYNKSEIGIDALANLTMNMGGIASAVEGNPFADWSVIAFPYATGDFHAGTGDFPYTDAEGRERVLYHHGYTNFRLVMDRVAELGVMGDADAVVVAGYSAGGFASALLADDVFGDYFPAAESKTVLVDSSLLVYDDWRVVAENVWEAPGHIAERLASDDITLDCLVALRETRGDTVNILFDCSTRDGDLAKVQNYLDDGVMDVDETQADEFEQLLAERIPAYRERAGANVFIWDGLPWYDDPSDLTQHTIIATPTCFLPLGANGESIAQWLADAVAGNAYDVGLELLEQPERVVS